MDGMVRAFEVAWQMLEEAGVYVIVGLLAAGLVHVLASRAWMARHLGGQGFGSVVKAALVGAPLPLCSCSVLPAALALRKKGAGRGATVSFLISTPETGVDSIAVTWALMGPVMAAVRPLAAVLTAMVAGLVEVVREARHPETRAVESDCAVCGSDDCGHVAAGGRWGRFWRFILWEMGDDLGPTLAVGLVLAGVVTVLVPDGFFEQYVGSRWVSMLVMLAVGLPLYVCATASTPLAAALVAKGLSPGAALVLLLVGPATNLATVLVVARMLGKASAALYVGTIAVVSLACGAVLDAVVGTWHLGGASAGAHEAVPPWLGRAGAVLLAAYLAMAVGRWVYRKIRPSRAGREACGTGGAHGAEEGCCGSGGGAGNSVDTNPRHGLT